MAKKNLDEPVDGPFKIDESMFSDVPEKPPSSDDPAFTDDEVRAIMGEEEQKWVTEGEPELAPEPPAAPAPPPPPSNQQWVTEGEPDLNPFDEDFGDEANDGDDGSYASASSPPPVVDPDATKEGPAPTPRPPPPVQQEVVYEDDPPAAAPGDTSGLVTEYSPDEAVAVDDDDEGADLGSSAMTYLALGIGASMFGVIGALVVVLLLTSGGGDPKSDKSGPEPEVGNVEVRRGLNGPPKPSRIEENIREFEEREAEGEDGTVPVVPDGEADAPADTDAPAEEPAPTDVPDEEPAEEEDDGAPIGSLLD